MNKPLVYEVTLDIGADAAPEFDRWLADHVREMLALPGFQDARILSPENPEAPTTVRRVVQYTMAGRAELDRYLAEHAPRMRADGSKRFGEKLKTSRRVLDVDQTVGLTPALPGLGFMPEVERCRNCGTPLQGRFCAECGQRHHKAVATLRESFDDFAGSHFGFDTKFFHSIVPLLFRPGFLTREYCLGRQERYVKPFRLYLFTSILFFFLAAIFWPQLTTLGSDDNVKVNGKMVATAGAAAKQSKDETRAQIQSALQQLDSEPGDPSAKSFAKLLLQEELTDLDKPPVTAATKAVTAATAARAAAGPAGIPAHYHGPKLPSPDAATAQVRVATGDDGFIQIDDKDLKGGERNQFTRTLMNVKDHPQEFKKQLGQNLPKMMFVLMPLIAIFLKLFYIGSK